MSIIFRSDQRVFVNILKVIRREHITDLLRDFDFGSKITFETQLEKWRECEGNPLINSINSQDKTVSNVMTTTSTTAASTYSHRHLLYSKLDRSLKKVKRDDISLMDILNGTPMGLSLYEFYNKYSIFKEDQRTILINLIAKYFLDNDIHLSLSQSYRLEEEIVKSFPSEKKVSSLSINY